MADLLLREPYKRNWPAVAAHDGPHVGEGQGRLNLSIASSATTSTPVTVVSRRSGNFGLVHNGDRRVCAGVVDEHQLVARNENRRLELSAASPGIAIEQTGRGLS